MAVWSPRPAVLLVFLLLVVCFHIALCSSASSSSASKSPKPKMSSRKALLASTEDSIKPAKVAGAATKIKKKAVSDAKNQTKLIKPKKLEPSTAATKKTTAKTSLGSTTVKTKLPKLDKTAAGKLKSTESTKATKSPKTPSSMKATKPGKTVKSEATMKTKKLSNSTVDATVKPTKSTKKVQEATEVEVKAKAKESEEEVEAVVFAEEAEGSEDLMSEVRGLPARLHETLMPDLARLSSTSKAYLSAANAGIAEGVRPFLGGRWAAAAASAASVALLLLPLCLLTALVRRMGAYLPLLHRALLLAQAYLAIYFATLALAAAATGLEPLRFFHAASPAAYAWTQAAQSLGFVGYLVLQMVDLVAVFSGAGAPEESGAGTGEAAKALGLAQMVVGLAVGLHYYAAVFHRAAAGEAPRANWRVYAVYAACFVIVCACARAERRKKAYLAGSDGGAEEWKKS